MTDRLVGNFIDSNVFVVGDSKECFIVDAGVHVDSVSKTVAGRKVLGVLLTHGHYDHAYYAMDYAAKFGCKIYASEKAKQYLENADWNYSEGRFELNDFENFIFLKEQGELKFGKFVISYKLLGGHSEGDMLYKFGDEIFVGDVLLGRDMGRVDLYGGSKSKMAESLKFLMDENFATMHCGHGEDFPKATQDKVAALWLRFLKRNI